MSYSTAGVDLRKVSTIHSAIAATLSSTFANRAGLMGAPLLPIGHYAGLIDIGGDQALALHADGVGTKVLVAQKMRKFDTVGIDCVAMTVNDLICMGAEPLALLDYIALQREDGRLVKELASGLAEGARLAGVSVAGGETAVLGGMIKGVGGKGFDLAAMGVGLVDKGLVIDGRGIREGDLVVGIESSGLHSNGYTLARKALAHADFGANVPGTSTTVGEALLAPTRVYVRPALAAMKGSMIHGLAHITGGSFSKLQRLVGGRSLTFELSIPPPPPIFELIRSAGRISAREMYRTFNMGIGLCLVVPESEEGAAARPFEKEGFRALRIGSVRRGKGVRVNGVRVS